MKDLLFTQPKTQDIKPKVLGKTATGLRLYQKILVLLLSSSQDAYREDAGTQLTTYLGRANITGSNFLQSIGAAACTKALSLLDSQDRSLIDQLTATAQYSSLYITIKLTDGTTYTGALNI